MAIYDDGGSSKYSNETFEDRSAFFAIGPETGDQCAFFAIGPETGDQSAFFAIGLETGDRSAFFAIGLKTGDRSAFFANGRRSDGCLRCDEETTVLLLQGSARTKKATPSPHVL